MPYILPCRIVCIAYLSLWRIIDRSLEIGIKIRVIMINEAEDNDFHRSFYQHLTPRSHSRLSQLTPETWASNKGYATRHCYEGLPLNEP